MVSARNKSGVALQIIGIFAIFRGNKLVKTTKVFIKGKKSQNGIDSLAWEEYNKDKL